MGDMGRLRHIVGIIRTHKNTVGAEHLKQVLELVRCKARRSTRKLSGGRKLAVLARPAAVGARAPGMINAAGICDKITAAVNSEDF